MLPRTGPPALLPELFIDSIRSHEKNGLHTRQRAFQHGERVRVVSGPFRWVEGLFDRSINASGRVRILLSLVHGSAAVQIEATELEPFS